MKIILAFDSYKGCMTAKEACQAARLGMEERWPDAEVLSLPLSDGGEGLLQCLASALQLDMESVTVHGPFGETVTAHYALSKGKRHGDSAGRRHGDSTGRRQEVSAERRQDDTLAEAAATDDLPTAYIEMAEAAGLTLVPAERRNPLTATTYGVGEMMIDALRKGARRLVMGLGGSATCDAGRGMLQCLKENAERSRKKGNRDAPLWPADVEVVVACDVDNPLCGPRGAARVFAPQKGATPEQVELLEQQLRNFALATAQAGIAPQEMMDAPGAGAAGGMGYALMAYLGARLQSGIDLMLDSLHFDTHLAGADLVVTGEGRSDSQTLMGKVPMGVLQRAKRQGIPCHLVSGQTEDTEALLHAGFSSVTSINEGDRRPINQLMQKDVATENLRAAMGRLARE